MHDAYSNAKFEELNIMIDSICFFASNKDLYNIFGVIEREFDIKYCACYAYAENGKKADIEFNKIEEIADSYREVYYIVQKTQIMQTYCYMLGDEKKERYVARCDNLNCLTFRTAAKNPNGYKGDYEVHIPREYETEFTGALFKRIVREVKRNCVKIKYVSPLYVGEEMYKNIGGYILLSQRSLFPLIVTETNEAKRWWKNPNVRKFMDKPIIEQLPFLQDVFSQKRLKNFVSNIQRKDWTEDHEIYEGIMYKLWINKDLSLLKDVAALFDDGVKVKEPFYMRKTAMEELRDIEIDWAFSQKADGIKILLENLKNVPSAGFYCGNMEVIKTLFRKKYYETFKESILNVTDETKEIIRNTIENISDKRLLKQVNEVIGLLK